MERFARCGAKKCAPETLQQLMDRTVRQTMQIESLELQNFRNYRLEAVSFDKSYNVIFGENAQGKTNLLEAIVYLSCGKSPRARIDRELIFFEEEQARLSARVLTRDRDFLLEADLCKNRRRKLQVNHVPAKTASVLSSVYHTVFFCPEDLFLIREGAAVRRKFLDTALCQLRPRYSAALTAYNRAYEHKTRILRDTEECPDLLQMLPEFNERMIQAGAILIRYRARFIERLAGSAAFNHAECSGGRETLSVQYHTVSSIQNPLADIETVEQQLREHMNLHRSAEISSRLCLSGPHKDDLLIEIDGREAKSFASQGQTRTAALALKLAERELFYSASGEYPILLLDDVLSELDQRRQEFVLNRISGGQVFITCCEDDRLPALLGGSVFHVQNGHVTPGMATG